MYKRLIPDHLLMLKQYQGSNIIITYRGFPNYFLFELSADYPFISSFQNIFTNDLIDLRKILANRKNIIKNIINKDSGVNILLYEELLLIRDEFNLSLFDGSIVIINNNLFEEIPNQTNEYFIDLDRKLEEADTLFDTGSILSHFYSYSSFFDGNNYIQYLSFEANEYENVRCVSFFGKEVLDSNIKYEYISEKQIPVNSVVFKYSDNSYIKFKRDMFLNLMGSQTLVADNIALKSIRSFELNIIDYIFKCNNIELNILVEKNTIGSTYRSILDEILFTYWQSSNFRQLSFYLDPDSGKETVEISQGVLIEEIIQQCESALLNKETKDVFITSSTGSGKSILFQIPAIYLHNIHKTITIVISPLKALMYDQVRALHEKGVDYCAYINSDLSYIEREYIIERIRKDEVSIVYLSPELILSYDIRTFIGDRTIGLFVIDEAHLVTTWGRDFRVDYWYLGNYIRKLRKLSNYKFPVLAVTATAVYSGKNDMVFDTVESLYLNLPIIRIGNVKRNDIKFEIRQFKYKGSHDIEKLERTNKVIKTYIDNKYKALVYFPWITQLTTSHNMLEGMYKSKSDIYYSEVDKHEKQLSIEKFINNELLVVMATKAFGMGVDISDIQKVYHHAPSGSFSDYIQEIGRVARDKNITGYAEVDFNPKDLKYTKVLYGLSSIKQYQLKLTLKKINDIYKRYKKQNFLVSAEDFQYIFGDDNNIETKIKSALLLIEKDLISKYNFNVIVVRPKSMFSVVYAVIPNCIKEKFLIKYGNYVEIIQKTYPTDCIKLNDRNDTQIVHYNYGDIYRIQLNDIWEKFFSNESFPLIKRKFFEGTLFEEYDASVSPRHRLLVTLKVDRESCLRKIKEYFDVLESTLNKLQGYFEKTDFENSLKEYIGESIFRKRISDLLKNIYTTHDDGTFQVNDCFIVSRRKDGKEKLRVVSKKFIKVKHDIIKYFTIMFQNNTDLYDRYLPIDGPDTKEYIKVAYILETFALGIYELSGGQMPQIFIRINDPFRVNLLSNDDKYLNNILRDVHNRHEYSIEIMNSFFSSTMSDSERWDFIENYFLGID